MLLPYAFLHDYNPPIQYILAMWSRNVTQIGGYGLWLVIKASILSKVTYFLHFEDVV